NTRQLYGDSGSGLQPLQPAASSPSPGATAAVQGKGVGLMVEPTSLQNLTSSDVLWGLYRLYNSRTDKQSMKGATDDYDSDVYGSTAVDIPQTGGVDIDSRYRLRQGANGNGGGGDGGSGGGRADVGNGGGAGKGRSGNRLFPFCQPPYLLCADRDLVTFLGVATDQVVYDPTVLQYSGIGAIAQRALVGSTTTNLYDRTRSSSLTGSNALRFSSNVFFNGFNGALGKQLRIAGTDVDQGPKGRLLPDSVTVSLLDNSGTSTIDRVNYKPNWIMTRTGPGFATTAVNFGPYGNFRIPGGLTTTFTVPVPQTNGNNGGR
ncbi:hypothetical protein VaNZ11_004665, partial [Volvox africanus]